jgi:drug/metabolite transporter (DMT)-like permease
MRKSFSAYLILLLTAAIWGLAFVAQRKGMESLDPFSFNAIRFALGALCVWIISAIPGRKRSEPKAREEKIPPEPLGQPLLLGVLLFLAASLQQTGMLWTGAGSAGFITGLYVVFVPLFGLFRRQRLTPSIVLAVALSLAGLALINGTARLEVTLGNALVLLGAVFWALHVQMIDKLTRFWPSLKLAFIQYAVCALLSIAGSVVYRFGQGASPLYGREFFSTVASLAVPIIYAGVFSVAIAFTLQLYAQKKVPPQAASVILCMEGVFAMFGGWLLLGEEVSGLTILGAVLLLLAMLVSALGERGDFLIDKKRRSEI